MINVTLHAEGATNVTRYHPDFGWGQIHDAGDMIPDAMDALGAGMQGVAFEPSIIIADGDAGFHRISRYPINMIIDFGNVIGRREGSFNGVFIA